MKMVEASGNWEWWWLSRPSLVKEEKRERGGGGCSGGGRARWRPSAPVRERRGVLGEAGGGEVR